MRWFGCTIAQRRSRPEHVNHSRHFDRFHSDRSKTALIFRFRWPRGGLCDNGSSVIPPKNHWIVIRVLLLTSVLLAMANSAQAERLPIRIYSSADGLGSSFINYLMRDSRGFLWVCTRDGLSRFDGSSFVTYQVGDGNAPPGIEQIIETSKGIYWIVTTGGLYRFDPNAPLTAHESNRGDRPTLNAQFVSDSRGLLYKDRSGSLWLAGSGLHRVIERDGKPIFESVALNLPGNLSQAFYINNLCEAQDGSFWLLTRWGVIRRLPNGKQVIYTIDDPRTNVLRGMTEDNTGRIWVGGTSNVYVIRPEPASELMSV